MIGAMRNKATIQAYAEHFGVSRPTIHAWLRRYNEANRVQYDSRNIQSVFAFFEFLQNQFYLASFRKAQRHGARSVSSETTGEALLRLAKLGEKLQTKVPPDLSARIDEILYGDG
jgi:transposase-like protein